MANVAERRVADELRAFVLRYARDEDLDYIESAYADGDVDELRSMAMAVAVYSGHSIPAAA